MKIQSLLLVLTFTFVSQTLFATDQTVPQAEIEFVSQLFKIIEGDQYKEQDISRPSDFVKRVKGTFKHTWKDHQNAVRSLAAGLRESRRDINEINIQLINLRINPGNVSLCYETPYDIEALKKSPRVIVQLPPMNGLNVLLALKWVENLIRQNNSITAFLVNETVPTKISDHNELVSLIKSIGINLSGLPLELPKNSRELYLWAAPQVLQASSALTVIESNGTNLPSAMKSFKQAKEEMEYVIFAANGKYGEENKNKIFAGEPNVATVTLKPTLSLANTFYGKSYKANEGLERNLDFLVAMAMDIVRIEESKSYD
ncbi:MAG: hypothetical protein ACPGXY_06445 [Alphaproteobacteria bacterium]